MNKFFIKFFAVILCLTAITVTITLFGCEKEKNLADSVNKLRINEYYGKSDDFELKCAYGYSTVNGTKVYALEFRLLNCGTDEPKREIVFDLGEKKYDAVLSLDPVSDCKTATVETTENPNDEFTVLIKTGADSETVKLVSIIPENTLSYTEALSFLEKEQSQLLSHYKDENGTFCGSISMRIFVKKDKAFWYVCLTDINGLNKALLIDGKTGEILAVRNII